MFNPRFKTLDHWRGLAALAVLVFHATSHHRTSVDTPGVLLQTVGFFWLGVQLFFVVSGYCIAAAVESSFRRSDQPCRDYFVRRVRRIYPPYLVWLLVLTGAMLLLAQLGPSLSGLVPQQIRQMTPANWVGNILLTETWSGYWFGKQAVIVTRVGWTLCFEFQFYMICMALMLAGPKRFLSGIFLVTLVATALFVFEGSLGTTRLFRGTFLDGRWPQFAMGVVLFRVLVHGTPFHRRLFAGVLILVMAFCALRLMDVNLIHDMNYRVKRIFELSVCAGFTLLLLVLRSSDTVISDQAIMKPLSLTGIISYSLYLVHWPICQVLSRWFWNHGVTSTSGTLLITAPACLIISLGPAWMLYRWIEKPSLTANSRLRLSPVSTSTQQS